MNMLEELSYDPLTGNFYWLKSGKGRQMDRPVGALKPNGYIHIKFNYEVFAAHRLAWFFYYGDWPEDCIDHINRNKSDNRIANLRDTNLSVNRVNAGLPSNNTSGFKGVTFESESGKWRARLGRFNSLGTFNTKEEAAAAYQNAAERLYALPKKETK